MITLSVSSAFIIYGKPGSDIVAILKVIEVIADLESSRESFWYKITGLLVLLVCPET